MAGRPAPIRTCVGCRERGAKDTLLRVVRARSGALGVDPSGGAPGRGAYVHPDTACIDLALRRGALVRALRTGIGRDELGRLRDDLQARAVQGKAGAT